MSNSDAFIGLDRKAWTSNIPSLSESYQFDFTIPEDPPFECHEIERVEITIDLSINDNSLDPDCFLGFWTHVLPCHEHDPISCDASDVLFDMSGYNSDITLTQDLFDGLELGIDLVVLSDAFNPICSQFTISDGTFDADIEVCVDIYYVPIQVDEEIDLGDDLIICAGETIDIEGPPGFEDYTWEGPVDGDEETLENAIAGVYTLDVYDENGCRLSDEIEVIEESFTIGFNEVSPIFFCSGSSTSLEAFIEEDPDLSNYSFDWVSPSNEAFNGTNITITEAGTYELNVTSDLSDCVQTEFFQVVDYTVSIAQIDSISMDSVLICSASDIELTAFVGFMDTVSYSFEWITPTDTLTTSSLTAQMEGDYILNMYNDLGCPSSSDTINIIFQDDLSAGEDSSSDFCQGETLSLNTLLSSSADAGGNWTNSNSSSLDLSQNNVDLNLPEGSYPIYYIVGGSGQCPADSSEHLINIINETVNAGNDIQVSLCNEDNIPLDQLIDGNPNGVFFNDSGDQLSDDQVLTPDLVIGLNSFNYIVEGLQCSSDTAIVTVNLAEEINTTIIDDILCEGDSLIIEGVSYTANNSSDMLVLNTLAGCDSMVVIDLQFISNPESDLNLELCEGNEFELNGTIFDASNASGTVILENASVNSCDSIVNVSVEFTQSVSELITPTICEGEQIDINGTIYDSSNPTGSQDFISVDGCDSILTIQLQIIQNSDSLLRIELCEDESIQINGTTFNSDNLTDTQMLINNDGCDSMLTIQVELLSISENFIDGEYCEGEVVEIAGFQFDSNNTADRIILDNQNYLGCDSIINVDLRFNENVEVEFDYEICLGDSLFIVDEWVFDEGVYQDILNTSNNCDSLIISNLTTIDCNVTVSAEITSSIQCFGDADAAVSIELSDNTDNLELRLLLMNATIFSEIISGLYQFEISDLELGVYTLELIDPDNGSIIYTEDISISSPSLLTVDEITQDNLCNGDDSGSAELIIQGGTGSYSVVWSNSQSGLINGTLSSGDYSYTVTDENNCSVEGSISINEPDPIEIELSQVDADCQTSNNGIVNVENTSGGTGPYMYSLDGSNYSSDLSFTDLAPGNYQLYAQDQNNCGASSDFMIVSLDDLTVEEIPTIELQVGETYQLQYTTNFTIDSIVYSSTNDLDCDNCTDPVITANESTDIQVELFDENGCSVTLEIRIRIIEPSFNDIFIPNIFSLNSRDGVNGNFRPLVSSLSTIEFIEMQIYDRWGNLVYLESPIDEGWDGYIDNRKALQGVYVYKINYILNGENLNMIGQLTLVR